MNRRGFIQAIFATAAITTVLTRVRVDAYPVGHAFRYGADPNGVMDSSYALSAAIAESRGVGATVYFPPGHYRFSQTLEFQKDVPIEIENSKIVLESGRALYLPEGWAGKLRYNHIYMPEYARVLQAMPKIIRLAA